MSMSEERYPGDLRGEAPSSFKVALAVIGTIAGIGILFCSGVAGYVAWQDRGRPRAAAEQKDNNPAPDIEGALSLLRKIADIDVPAGFEPLDMENMRPMRKITFGRKGGDDGAFLKLASLEAPVMRPGEPAPEGTGHMVQQMLEMGAGQTSTILERVPASEGTTHELNVLGKLVPFQFVKGPLASNKKVVWKVSGSFSAGRGPIALIYTIPEDEFDEEAVVRMIESIRPPDVEGDFNPRAVAPSPPGPPQGSAAAPANDEPPKNPQSHADDEKSSEK